MYADEMVAKSVCEPLATAYLTAQSLQAWTTFTMAIDLFLNLIMPFRYRLISTYKFALVVLGCLVVPYLFNVYVHYFGFKRDPQTLTSCSGLMVLTHEKQLLWVVVQELAVVATFTVYIATILAFKFKLDLNNGSNQQALRSVIIILGVFTVLCMIGVTSELILELIDIDEELRTCLICIVMLHMFICFSQNFYISMWRSSIYRTAFKSNMERLFCIESRKKYSKNSVASFTLSSKLVSSQLNRRQTII